MRRPTSFDRRTIVAGLGATLLAGLHRPAMAQRTYESQSPRTFAPNEVVSAGHRFFGGTSRGLANLVERATQQWGRPTAYILGQEGSGAFVAGLPSWCVLIGLVKDGKPILGVIDQPWLDERYVGVGDEAWLECRGERTPLKTRDCPRLTEAVLSTTDPFILTAPERGAFEHIRATARLTRYGLDAYAYARLAAGTIDMVTETGLKPHDVAALFPVIEGAGGVITDWRGNPAQLGGQIVAAANRKILDEALVSLRRSAL